MRRARGQASQSGGDGLVVSMSSHGAPSASISRRQARAPVRSVSAVAAPDGPAEFIELAFAQVGRNIAWRGQGDEEVGFDSATAQQLVKIDRRYFRPTEVDARFKATQPRRDGNWAGAQRLPSPTLSLRW